ncbi:MAG TPA: HAMP domain-containing sensor histidine kinase [Longimicrobiales bacterium]|nr:HAMP domain-containing sensor histidine kinase [Longimicrobiales bacterium]
MTLRQRFFFAFLAVLGLVVLPGAYGIFRIRQIEEIVRTQRERATAAQEALGALEKSAVDAGHRLRIYVATGDADAARRVTAAITSARNGLDVLARLGFAAPDVEMRLDTLDEALRLTRGLMDAGLTGPATEYLDALRPTLAELPRAITPAHRAVEAASAAAVAEAEAGVAHARLGLYLMLGSALLGALVLAVYVTRVVVVPLRRLQGAMSRVAGGEFDVRVAPPSPRADEIGDLFRSFRTMAEDLAALERMRAEFVGMVSHDLKSPLQTIHGFAELAEAGVYGPASERLQGAQRAIQEAALDVLARIEQLQHIGSLDGRAFRISRGLVSTFDLLRSVEARFAPIVQRRGIELDVRLDPAAPETFAGDFSHLRDQVLGNLVGNAAKFTDEGGRIVVRAFPDQGHLVLEVEDTGAGIPADDLPHIFDKYFRGRSGTASAGAGLGLAIARQIVRLHGGELTAESELGRGSTFRARIPLAGAAGAALPGAPRPAEREGPAAPIVAG